MPPGPEAQSFRRTVVVLLSEKINVTILQPMQPCYRINSPPLMSSVSPVVNSFSMRKAMPLAISSLVP